MGKSWTEEKINIKLKDYDFFSINTGTIIYAMRFIDKDNGILLLPYKNNDGIKYFVLRTKDGGKKWSVEKTPLEGLLSVYISRDGKYITANNQTKKIIQVIKN